MNHWFGQDWGAPVCDPARWIPTPVGEVCGWCGEEIAADDRGTTMSLVGTEGPRVICQHAECDLRAALGSVAHQQGRCRCFGGEEEDDPALSLREAAIAAVRHALGDLPWE